MPPGTPEGPGIEPSSPTTTDVWPFCVVRSSSTRKRWTESRGTARRNRRERSLQGPSTSMSGALSSAFAHSGTSWKVTAPRQIPALPKRSPSPSTSRLNCAAVRLEDGSAAAAAAVYSG